jgi:hypothetical protein
MLLTHSNSCADWPIPVGNGLRCQREARVFVLGSQMKIGQVLSG